MNKKVFIGIIVVAIIIVVTILIINITNMNNKEQVDDKAETNIVNSEGLKIYDPQGNLYYDSERKDEITEIKENITIQGLVELKKDTGMYLFNGQHFGEFGFEMEEYTRVNIKLLNQKCIDYITGKEYDTNYIEVGDIVICTGNLLIKAYSGNENDFDTKDNEIIVLKSAEFKEMKIQALDEQRDAKITIGQYFSNGKLYLKYSIIDKNYCLPFALELEITDNTKVIGNLEKGKSVKVEYVNANEEFDNLKLKSIQVY